ncbi:MAG: hypothetical protein ACRCXT_00545 [Paraclostridium sp.]
MFFHYYLAQIFGTTAEVVCLITLIIIVLFFSVPFFIELLFPYKIQPSYEVLQYTRELIGLMKDGVVNEQSVVFIMIYMNTKCSCCPLTRLELETVFFAFEQLSEESKKFIIDNSYKESDYYSLLGKSMNEG